MFGVVVATIAMICTLSVFNGFRGLFFTQFSFFDPDLKIAAVAGKVFDPTTEAMTNVCGLPEIQQFCGVLQEENALVRYGDRQEISALKGVDASFRQLVRIDTAIIDGEFVLSEGEFNYAVLGRGLAYTLGVNAAFAFPLEIFMPERMGTINPANPAASYVQEYVYIKGVYYIKQPVYDERFMFLSIDLMRSMLGYEKEVSALELKLTPDADISAVKKKILNLTGDGFTVKDRFEQQEATFKITQIEKWVTFLMLCFILVLALFNVLSSLAILMIEKEEDVKKLRSMGADNRLINRIFLFEGWMISLLGAVIGVIVGIGLCFLQQQFGLIKLGEMAGTFIVDAYPVKVDWPDVFIVLLTVFFVGFIAVLYPVYYFGKKRLHKELIGCLLCITLLTSCGGGSGQKTGGETQEIAVSIEPLCFFGEKIAGDDYTFFSVVPSGRGPETYDPSLREMLRVGKSKAFLYINQLGFEQVLINAIQKNQTGTHLFDLSVSFDFGEAGKPDMHHQDNHLDEAENPDAHHHDNHSGEEQDALHAHHHGHHGGHDPHIWTSFAGAKVISENTYKALSALTPAKSDFYQANYRRLTAELEQLERDLHAQLDTLSCRGFVIFHPALTYFAKEFRLNQYSMEEDGKDPSPATLKKLIEKARAEQVKVVFVQLEFDRKHAEQVAAEIDARIVMINPLDHQWDEQMKRIAKALTTNGKVD